MWPVQVNRRGLRAGCKCRALTCLFPGDGATVYGARKKISGPATRMAMRRPAAKIVTGGKQSRLVITLYLMVKPARVGFSPVSIPARTVVKHPVWWSSNPSVS